MKEIESALQDTFNDRKLSQNEKYALMELLKDYQNDPDALNFARNSAFKIVKQHQYDQPQFDPDAFKWLEHTVKSIDRVRTDHLPTEKDSAYFSPGDDCKRRIISAIKHAKQAIDVCVFTISDDQISQALLDAHRRSIKVRIITDNDKANDLGSDVDMLQSKGVPLVKDTGPHHMHHKFAIIDNRFLINGSFNWTRSASTSNEENITIAHSPELLNAFRHEFDKLWADYS